MTNLLLSALMMALASYIPRAIPLIFCRKKIKSVFIRSFLFYMPYAVLSALTFPSIFYSTGNIWTALIGTAVAIGLSFIKPNIALVAVVCVGVVFGFSFVF